MGTWITWGRDENYSYRHCDERMLINNERTTKRTGHIVPSIKSVTSERLNYFAYDHYFGTYLGREV